MNSPILKLKKSTLFFIINISGCYNKYKNVLVKFMNKNAWLQLMGQFNLSDNWVVNKLISKADLMRINLRNNVINDATSLLRVRPICA